jgi:hypothetical protein
MEESPVVTATFMQPYSTQRAIDLFKQVISEKGNHSGCGPKGHWDIHELQRRE